MKQTLLEMVQRISDFISGEAVNSISQSRESKQIANIVKETYFDMLTRKELDAKENFFTFDNLIEPELFPTYLKLKEDCISILYVKYLNEETNTYTELCYEEPEVFIQKQMNIDSNLFYPDGTSRVVDIVDFSGVKFKVRNDKHPSRYTIIDDMFLVFDSYNLKYDDTIQQAKVNCYGTFAPPFILEDDFVPHINAVHFPALLSLSKNKAAYELKEWTDPLEFDRANKQVVLQSRLGKRIEKGPSTIWKNRQGTGRRSRGYYGYRAGWNRNVWL